MSLESLLAQRKKNIVRKWFDLVVETYPEDTLKFLKSQKDPFANPVGNTTIRGLRALFDELLSEMNYETVTTFLDPIIRIRAVQDFSPSQATGFVLSLKKIIRENIENEIYENQMINNLLQLESKIDELSLIAFNIYMKCREKIYQLKANEAGKRTFSAFKRAGLIAEIPEDEPDLNKSIA
jgi:hypothetical protein